MGALLDFPPCTGRVVSVYSRAINILVPDGVLVSLVEKPAQMSALAVCVPAFFQCIRQTKAATPSLGQEVMVAQDTVELGTYTVVLNTGSRFSGLLVLEGNDPELGEACGEPDSVHPGSIQRGSVQQGSGQPGCGQPGCGQQGSIQRGSGQPGFLKRGHLQQGFPGHGCLQQGCLQPGRLSIFHEALVVEGKRGGLLGIVDPNETDSMYTRKCRSALERLRITGNNPALIRGLSCLVGLGIGFTPSGDDFISGALLAECLLNSVGDSTGGAERQAIDRDEIRESLDRTNAGGKTLLWQTLQYRFPFYLLELARGFLEAHGLVEMRRTMARAASYGETSGTDAAAGFFWLLDQRVLE